MGDQATSGSDRRHILRVLGATSLLSGLGCSGRKGPPPCLTVQPGGAHTYCLVEAGTVRVPGAARLVSGQALLYNVEDDTAVVVARDEGGLFAVSAICTHQCCLLALCNNVPCTDLRSNPGTCGTSPLSQPSPTGVGLFCACHGSTFRLDGTPIAGPATIPLPHYALSVQGDDVVVSIAQTVALDVRV